jgi:hypothetical protein
LQVIPALAWTLPSVVLLRTRYHRSESVFSTGDPIHQTQITPYPPDTPPGYCWYGRKRLSPGRPPRWLEPIGAVSDLADGDEYNNLEETLEHSLPDDVEDSDAAFEDKTAGDGSEIEERTTEESRRCCTGRYFLCSRIQPPSRFQ